VLTEEDICSQKRSVLTRRGYLCSQKRISVFTEASLIRHSSDFRTRRHACQNCEIPGSQTKPRS
jgi:hypothetical protein